MKHWLETSALVTLHFRNRRARAACVDLLPLDGTVVVSRYVIFELSRGFLTYLRGYHNESFSCLHWYELRNLIKAGSRDHLYEGKAWRDVLDDLEEALEVGADDEPDRPWDAAGRKPAFFRSRLRLLVYSGWKNALQSHGLENPCGCRSDLPDPHEDEENRLHHSLPKEDCGKEGNCGVLNFMRANQTEFLMLREKIARSKAKAKKRERESRTTGIDHLLQVEGETFTGECCHHCGDAMICMEARDGNVVTKDGDYKALTKVLGSKLSRVPHI